MHIGCQRGLPATICCGLRVMPEGKDITSQQVWKKFLYKTRHEGLNSRKSILGGFLGHSVIQEERKKEGCIP